MKTIISNKKGNWIFRYSPREGEYHNIHFYNGRSTQPDTIADRLISLGAVSGAFTLAPIEEQAISTPGNSVLLIRDMGLGDLLMMTPLIRHLAARGLAVDLHVSDRYECLFVGNPSVRQTYALGTYVPENYAAKVDLRQHVERMELGGHYQHRAQAFATYMDIDLHGDLHADYFPSPEEMAVACMTIDPKRKSIVFAWSASQPTRSWTSDRNIAIIRALAEEYQVIVVAEYGLLIPLIDNVVNMGGLNGIRAVAALAAAADCVVSPDTGIFHLAGALNIPTVAVFSTHPLAERQAHKTLVTLNKPESCNLFPCRKYNCLHKDRVDISPCIDVTPEDAVAAVHSILG